MSVEKSEKPSTGAIDRGQMLLIALVALALIASVIMLVTDSNTALKFALIASLWAAVIGFFMVTRYRREAQRSEEKLQHERELNEVAAAKEKAEQQAEQEKFAREYQEQQRAEDTDTLSEIQQELAELRANLEALSGQEFGYEPAALRAQARRIMELESEGGSAPRGPQVKGAPSSAAVTGLLGQTPKEPMRRDMWEGPSTAETEIVRTPEEIATEKSDTEKSNTATGPQESVSADTGRKNAAGAGKDSSAKATTPEDSSAAEPAAKIPTEKSADRDDVKAAVKSTEPQPTESARPHTPSTSETRVFNSGSFTAVKWDAVGDKHVADKGAKAAPTGAHTAKPEASKDTGQGSTKEGGENTTSASKSGAAAAPGAQTPAAEKNTGEPLDERSAEEKTAEEKAAEEKAAEEKAAEERRGRRRRDERSDGVSVADLLANIKKGDQ